MKAKLIKVNDNQLDGGFYILRDLNGNPIALEGNLSLKNCQAIERGYDLDELADEHANQFMDGKDHFYGFKAGFQKALELMGDKKYTEKQMLNMFLKGDSLSVALKSKIIEDKPISDIFNKAIQSLQQTEWDVEIEMEPMNLDEIREQGKGFLNANTNKPKLDADGFLILKPIK